MQLFSHTNLVLYAGKTLDTITQGEAEETFGFIENDLDRLAAASCFTELVDRLTMEKQPLPKVFHLLLATLRMLGEADPELLGRIFEIKLLAMLGYRPQLDGCVMGAHSGWQERSPGIRETGPVWFSIERGGVLCPDCAARCPGATSLSPAAVAALAYFLRTPADRAVRVKIEKRCRLELGSFLRAFISYHGDVRPRAWQFVDGCEDHHSGGGAEDEPLEQPLA